MEEKLRIYQMKRDQGKNLEEIQKEIEEKEAIYSHQQKLMKYMNEKLNGYNYEHHKEKYLSQQYIYNRINWLYDKYYLADIEESFEVDIKDFVDQVLIDNIENEKITGTYLDDCLINSDVVLKFYPEEREEKDGVKSDDTSRSIGRGKNS